MRAPLRHIAVTTAVVLAAGCGAQEATNASSGDLSATLEQIERKSTDPVYWLGSSFEGLRLTDAEAPQPAPTAGPTLTERAPGVPGRPPAAGPGAFFVYGECNGEGTGEAFHCTGPQVQLQHWPISSPSRYPADRSCTRTTIRGVPAAQFDGFEVYVGSSLVKISAPTRAQARRVAAALRPLDGSATAREPLPPPAIDVDDGLRRCALDSLEATLDELRKNARIPLLWLGRGFEELPLFRAEGDGRFGRFLYGGCKTPEEAGSCYPALTVEVSPVSDRRPADWRAVRQGVVRCERLHIRGAEAALLPSAAELAVFTGPAAVILRAPDLARLRRAADALYPFEGRATSAQLTPPSGELTAELARVCPARGG